MDSNLHVTLFFNLKAENVILNNEDIIVIRNDFIPLTSSKKQMAKYPNPEK